MRKLDVFNSISLDGVPEPEMPKIKAEAGPDLTIMRSLIARPNMDNVGRVR